MSVNLVLEKLRNPVLGLFKGQGQYRQTNGRFLCSVTSPEVQGGVGGHQISQPSVSVTIHMCQVTLTTGKGAPPSITYFGLHEGIFPFPPNAAVS